MKSTLMQTTRSGGFVGFAFAAKKGADKAADTTTNSDSTNSPTSTNSQTPTTTGDPSKTTDNANSGISASNLKTFAKCVSTAAIDHNLNPTKLNGHLQTN